MVGGDFVEDFPVSTVEEVEVVYPLVLKCFGLDVVAFDFDELKEREERVAFIGKALAPLVPPGPRWRPEVHSQLLFFLTFIGRIMHHLVVYDPTYGVWGYLNGVLLIF